MSDALLIEIGCEEIPARMIAAAAGELGTRVTGLLDQAGLAHGPTTAWGGTRRLAVHVAAVEERLADRRETVLGPPASAAFDADGRPTPAGAGFAKKQGIAPSELKRLTTDKGQYAGFERAVLGRTIEQVLAAALPPAVAAMPFPKTMRWGEGKDRWVRPVHWLVALHGTKPLAIELFGVASGTTSRGHRFLSGAPPVIPGADGYAAALREAKVLVRPEDRRGALRDLLQEAARKAGGTLVEDDALLDETADLVEWPGVVVGRFDPAFLELPREILVTTLRHHQKSFSVEGDAGLLPVFLSVANTDRDPGGHVRRGNEWVVVGRLDDARFFWTEDRKRPLASRVPDLARVVFHKALGSYAQKVERTGAIASELALRAEAKAADRDAAIAAAPLSKADLVTGLVGEFPELQGIVGGLLLAAEGAEPGVATAVAEHYRPVSAEDGVSASAAACLVGLADRLDTIRGLIEAGETPTGSRDPFGLRRAVVGMFRILAERDLPLTMRDLFEASGHSTKTHAFLQERLDRWLEDRGYTPNEVRAVRRPKVSPTDFDGWTIGEIARRLDAVKRVRGREDFAKLVELTKRVDNILVKGAESIDGAEDRAGTKFRETHETALALARAHDRAVPAVETASKRSDYAGVIDAVGTLVAPVAKFFDDVLVLDPKNPAATRERCDLLARVRTTVTRDFDIRELSGQADAKP